MNRRTFLVGAAIPALTGCTARNRGSPGTTETETTTTKKPDCNVEVTTGDAEVTGDPLREVSVVSVDSTPVDELELDVAVFPSTITTEHTVEVRIAATNVTADRREFGFGRPAPFATRMSNGDPGWVFLNDDVVNEENQPERKTDDCWKPQYESEGRYQHLDIIDQHHLEPCERLAVTYELWSHHESNPCMPTGEFRFEDNSFVVYDDEAEGEDTEFAWGFTLGVEAP